MPVGAALWTGLLKTAAPFALSKYPGGEPCKGEGAAPPVSAVSVEDFLHQN